MNNVAQVKRSIRLIQTSNVHNTIKAGWYNKIIILLILKVNFK